MTSKRTAPGAEAGAAAPEPGDQAAVHTRAQGDSPPKPAIHLPTKLPPRDAYTGKGGTYTRDPATGERTPTKPQA